MKRLASTRNLLLWLSTSILVAGASATTSDMLVTGPKAQVTKLDVQVEIASLPEAVKDRIHSDPTLLKQLAESIYMRRAAMADGERLAKDNTALQSRLEVAREKALADIAYESYDQAAALTLDKALAFAQSTYRAQPERFSINATSEIRQLFFPARLTNAACTAEQALSDLKGGTSFEAMAEKLGDPLRDVKPFWLIPGQFGTRVDTVVSNLKPGALSNVVSSDEGYHVIQLVSRGAPKLRLFNEVSDELMLEAQQKAVTEARKKVVANLTAGQQVNAAAIASFAKDLQSNLPVQQAPAK